jgi:NTP pyrophosphatase (non-canonical NTP hydrolase)
MQEAVSDSLELPSVLTFDKYQALTASKAQYEQAPNPELVLRNGLIEEAAEILDTHPDDQDEMHKEIGDVLWYLSEVSRFKGLSLKEVANLEGSKFETFDAFQDAQTLPEISPIHTPEQQLLSPADKPQEALAVLVMRVVDVMNPKTNELWEGFDERPQLSAVLRDAMTCITQIANANNIRLNEAAGRTLTKIYSRPRNPHVIDNANALIDSERDRLNHDPWVIRLLGKTAMNDAP